jgi:hypothetical protein
MTTRRMSIAIQGAYDDARQLLADQRPGCPPLQVALVINGRMVFAGQLDELLVSSAGGQVNVTANASDQLQRIEESAERRLEAAAKDAPKP